MKAIVQNDYGSPDVYELKEIDIRLDHLAGQTLDILGEKMDKKRERILKINAAINEMRFGNVGRIIIEQH